MRSLVAKAVCPLFVILATGAAGGCCSCARELDEASKKQAALQKDNEQCRREKNELEDQASQLRGQVDVLRGFGAGRLEQLIYPVKAEFGRFTRGYDTDGDGVDDGVIVYLELSDRTGDAIKAAGRVEIEMWDLAASPEQSRLGQWKYAIDELPQYWLAGMMANHYRFELKWPDQRHPEHKNLTVKARFYCALTGKVLESQRMVEIK
jgi:hypothetical protein